MIGALALLLLADGSAADSPGRAREPSTGAREAGLLIGQHFHRIPGPSEDGPVLVPYHFTRSLNNDFVGALQWWVGGRTRCEAGLGPSCEQAVEYDWQAVDRWAAYHSRPDERRLLITFANSPPWASARPKEPSPYCDACGYGAEPAPAYRAAYARMVRATVSRYRDRLLGVECWNEPYFDDRGKPLPSSYFTGTPTALADVCRLIHTATKSVDPNILVFCPQAPSAQGMRNVLAARTSDGEPIHRFCDVVGAHTYNAVGRDQRGRELGTQSIVDAVRIMRAELQRIGIDKPIAITEWGFDDEFRTAGPEARTFAQLSSAERGELVYRTLATLKDLGVYLIGLYSYDSHHQLTWRGVDPRTRRPTYDPISAARLADAVQAFGPRPPK